MPSSSNKMLSVLDLYTAQAPVWTVEAIAPKLNTSVATAYRYVGELCAAGLLTRVAGGNYVLGPRIVQLEFLMREVDPIANLGRPIIRALVSDTGGDVLLSNVYGEHLVNVLHERGVEDLALAYVRGRPHPMFRGAMSKAILAFLPRSRLLRIHAAHAREIAAGGLGASWLEFWRTLQAIRKAGFAVSRGELDRKVVGFAAPVFNGDDVLGSVGLAVSERRLKRLDETELTARVVATARKLSEVLEGIAHPGTAVMRARKRGR